MKCVLAGKLLEFVLTSRTISNIDEGLIISTDMPRPTLDPRGQQMLLRVEACSIAPLDMHLITGACSRVLKPPKYPYVPGSAVCGIVEKIAKDAKFKLGDRVIASGGMLPIGGLAEYMVVHIKSASLAPANVDAVGAATLPVSPMTAMLLIRASKVHKGDRVLVLGGSGGVGTSLVQLVRDAGASFVATTSTDESLMTSLGADKVIDYRTTKWWEIYEFIEQPFDVVLDCVGWRDEWKEAARAGALKPGHKGGRYFTIASTDQPKFKTIWEGLRMFIPVLWRMLWTTVYPWKPRYQFMLADPVQGDYLELSRLVEEKRLRPVLDPSSPFPFTMEGVKQALQLQASKHAHGRVVIKISD